MRPANLHRGWLVWELVRGQRPRVRAYQRMPAPVGVSGLTSVDTVTDLVSLATWSSADPAPRNGAWLAVRRHNYVTHQRSMFDHSLWRSRWSCCGSNPAFADRRFDYDDFYRVIARLLSAEPACGPPACLVRSG
jgi:hypothetical protein